MSPSLRRLSALVAAVAFIAVLGIAGPSGPATDAVAQGVRVTSTPPPEGPIPCDPTASRTINPRVVEAGGEVEVNIRYNFNCTGEDRKINIFLVVENTSYLGGPRNQALANVRDGLLRFVNQVNYLNGSCGGLTLFAEDYTNRVTLRCGNEGKEALLEAIGRISVEPVGNSAGAGAAIRDATERLPTNVGDSGTNVLLVVDAGAPVVTPPLLRIQDACKAAYESKVHVMTVGLENAGYRMGFCATNGWARFDPSPDARGFPAIMDELAEALVKGQQADTSEVLEALRSSVTLVPGAQPFDPDNPYANDFVWSFQGNPPPSGQTISYKIKLDEELIENEIFSPSIESSLSLFYKSGQFRTLLLPEEEICVYKRGDPSFCAGYPPATPTPTPTRDSTQPTPTDTVEPSVTPTQDATATDPGPTIVPTVTDTPQGPTTSVYLPATLKQAGFGSP
jgi:hypothetical protein